MAQWPVHWLRLLSLGVEDLVVCLGDCNGYLSRHIDGFDGDCGGYVVGQIILEGRMLLEVCLVKNLCANTWFKW